MDGAPGEMFRHVAWPFPLGKFPAHLGVVVQRTVLSGDSPALIVIHTQDNDWLVEDGVSDPNLPDASVATHMSHVVQRNSSLTGLVDLPPGWEAHRDAPGQPWIRVRHEWPDDEPETEPTSR